MAIEDIEDITINANCDIFNIFDNFYVMQQKPSFR